MFSFIEFAFLLIKARKTLNPHSRIILKRDFYENESQRHRFQSAKSLNQSKLMRAAHEVIEPQNRLTGTTWSMQNGQQTLMLHYSEHEFR